MATKFAFNNRTVFEPGSYARVISGNPVNPVSSASGNVLIIDSGLGKNWGGGSGINGSLQSKANAIYSFDSFTEFAQFMQGGAWLDIANYLFTPGKGLQGINRLLFVAAKTSTNAAISYTFDGSTSPTAATTSVKMKAVTVAVAAGGTGYVVNDTIVVAGGTSTQAVTLKVDAVSLGVITGLSIVNGGSYSVMTTNPVAQATTSGSGVGATFTLSWGVASVAILTGGANYSDVTVAFTGGTPSTAATALATVVSGAITTITPILAGAGYSAVPTVAITNAIGGGVLVFYPKTEGIAANGVAVSGILSKGFACKLRAGVLDSTKFIIDFSVGSYKGLNELELTQNFSEWDSSATYTANVNVKYQGYAYKSLQATNTNQNPLTETAYWSLVTSGVINYQNSTVTDRARLLVSSNEFSTLNDFITWAQGNFTFNTYFTIGLSTVVGSGKLVPLDITNNSSLNLASGGTDDYGSQDYLDVLENIVEEDYNFVLANDCGANAQSLQNTLLLSHLVNDAEYDKYMFVAGGDDRNTYMSQSIPAAQYFDNSKAQVIHSGCKLPNSLGGTLQLPAIYSTAKTLGVIAGLAPETPGTWKGISISAPLHELSPKERQLAFDNGVLHFKNVPSLGWVINQNINTLQKNTQLVNPDGQSHEGTIERIKAQLNKELIINTRLNFVGKSLASSSPATVKTFVEGYLTKQVASATTGGLIVGFENVKVSQQQDAFFVEYTFYPNGPVNKIMITGVLLDSSLSA